MGFKFIKDCYFVYYRSWEYVAATEAGKEMIWLHGFLDELGKKQEMDILHNDS